MKLEKPNKSTRRPPPWRMRSGSGWNPKFTENFLVQRYVYDKFFQRYEPNCGKKCTVSQCQRLLLKIPGSGSKREWLSKFNQFFLVQRYITELIKFSGRSNQLLREVANRKKQKQTDKRRVNHNLLVGRNDICCPNFNHGDTQETGQSYKNGLKATQFSLITIHIQFILRLVLLDDIVDTDTVDVYEDLSL